VSRAVFLPRLVTPPCLAQFSPERYTVLYKRPTDLKLRQDVPVCCNLLLANIFDEGATAAAAAAVTWVGLGGVAQRWGQTVGVWCTHPTPPHPVPFLPPCRPADVGHHPLGAPRAVQPADRRRGAAARLGHRLHASCGAAHGGGVRAGHAGGQPVPLAPSLRGWCVPPATPAAAAAVDWPMLACRRSRRGFRTRCRPLRGSCYIFGAHVPATAP
jgi:hypothetical protein